MTRAQLLARRDILTTSLAIQAEQMEYWKRAVQQTSARLDAVRGRLEGDLYSHAGADYQWRQNANAWERGFRRQRGSAGFANRGARRAAARVAKLNLLLIMWRGTHRALRGPLPTLADVQRPHGG